MKTKFIKEKFSYDGSQLRPLFAFSQFSIEGESLVSWVGPCNVSNENMKDGEDLFAGDSIRGGEMCHFILELFEQNLMTMVSLQRLMSAMAGEVLSDLSGKKTIRDGDDLYFGEGKLSISIASKGAVSSMIHFAVNVNNEDTPVVTSSLEDLNVSVEDFVEKFFAAFEKEYLGIVRATKKVFAL